MAALDDIQNFLSNSPEVINLERVDTGLYCAMFSFSFSAALGAPIHYVYYDPHRNFIWNSKIVIRDAGREWETFIGDLLEYAESLRVVLDVIASPLHTIYYPAGYTVGTMDTLKDMPTTILKACDNASYFG